MNIHRLTVLVVLVIVQISSFASETTKDKYFTPFSGVISEKSRKEIQTHQNYLKAFSDKKLRTETFTDLYKEFIHQEWIDGEWVNTLFEISNIDTSGDVWVWSTDELIYIEGNWTNSHRYIVRTTPFSGENTMILSSDSYIWIEDGWINFSKIAYTYDGLNLVEVLMQIAVEENTFMPFQKFEYTYDENSFPSSETVSDFYTEWEPVYRRLFEYSAEGLMVESLESNWRDNNWTDSLRTKYNYIDDLPIEKTEYLFTEGIEDLYLKTVYEYSSLIPGLLIFEHEYYWNANTWEQILRTQYNYNEIFLLSEVVVEQRVSGDIFEFRTKISYQYNSAFLETENLYQEYDGSAWVNRIRMLTMYTPSSNNDGDVMLNAFELYNNYPNPFNPVTTISYSLPSDAKVKLRIFNSLGEEVKVLVDGEKSAGVHKINFTAPNLPSGIYFYRLESGNSVETKKMMLMK
jgi:hypothetical protein